MVKEENQNEEAGEEFVDLCSSETESEKNDEARNEKNLKSKMRKI